MNFDPLIKKARRQFWRPVWKRTEHPFHRLTSQVGPSLLIIRLFYAINFYIWADRFRGWQMDGIDSIIVHPVWPIFWVNLNTSAFWASFFLFLNLITALAVLLFPGYRVVRAFAFLGLFFETAILHSDIGGWERLMCHAYDYTLIAFLFIFLPDKEDKPRFAAWKTSLMITLAQITILLSFASSGIWRIRLSALQIMSGMSWQDNSIGPTAYATFLKMFATANRSVEAGGTIGSLGPFLIHHIGVSGPLMAFATVFELSCLYVIFRPYLYRAYGILIALFFTFVIFTMNLPFVEHFLLALLFLTAAPSSIAKDYRMPLRGTG